MNEERKAEKRQEKAAVPAGELIARRRKELGLSQEALAEKLDVSRQAVAKWETGQTLPTAERLAELCRLLEVSPAELLGFSAQEETPAPTKKKRSLWTTLFVVGLVVIWGGGGLFSIYSACVGAGNNSFWTFLNLGLLWCLAFAFGLAVRALLKYNRS